MTTHETLIIINTILTCAATILFGLVSFFLRDIYSQFKTLVEKVNHLFTDLAKLSTESQNQLNHQREEITQLKERVGRLEGELIKKPNHE